MGTLLSSIRTAATGLLLQCNTSVAALTQAWVQHRTSVWLSTLRATLRNTPTPWLPPFPWCLLLQVLEETGYDIEDLVQEEEFIELTLDGKRNKLFIVAGLDPNSAQFAPKCKGVSTHSGQNCSLMGQMYMLGLLSLPP